MKHSVKYVLVFCLLLTTSLIYGVNFLEDWDSGDFATNGWTFENDEQANWTIVDFFGNPANSARFNSMPTLTDYDYCLVSQEFDATAMTEVVLDYDICSMFMMPGNNHMSIEVRTVGGDWVSLVTYSETVPAMGDWQHDEFDISSYVAGSMFQVGFRNTGTNSFDFMHWTIDNIHVSDGSAPVTAMPFVESWSSMDFATNGWTFDPSQGSWYMQEMAGPHGAVADFMFDDYLDYSYALVSPEIDATNSAAVTFDYDVLADMYEATGLEFFTVDVFDGTTWHQLAQYCNTDYGFDWTTENFDITNLVAGSIFQVRFVAHGADAWNINDWMVDNILINDGSPLPVAGVYGHVINDAAFEPITTAVVELDGVGQISIGDGGFGSTDYGFDFDGITPGDYTLRATADGFLPKIMPITLNNGDDLELNLFMQPSVDNPAPSYFDAEVMSLTDVECTWSNCQDDPTIRYSYDDGNADLYLDFQGMGNSQIVANRFVIAEALNLKYLSFYVDFGMTMPMGDDPSMKCYVVGDINGNPNMNNLLTDPVVITDFPNSTVTEPFWLTVPMEHNCYAGMTLYVCLEWNQTNAAANYFTLGADVTAPDEMTVSSMDGGTTWMPMTGQYAMDAMIRMGGFDSATRELVGFNLYRNDQLVNAAPLTETFYQDSGLSQGAYTYYVRALYDDGESAPSDSVALEVGFINPPTVYEPQLMVDNDEKYVSLLWGDPFETRALLGYNIYRDGVQLNNEILPVLTPKYYDYDIANTMTYEYTVESVFDEGVSDPSVPVSIQVLFPPQNFYGLPGDDYAALYWSAPELPAGGEILGYNVYLYGMQVNADLLTETTFVDTNVVAGEEYYYTVKVLYPDGESISSSEIKVEVGASVMLPATDVAAVVDDDDVSLSWTRPIETGDWFGWDGFGQGGAFGLDAAETYMAAVKYDEWDVIGFDSHSPNKVAFFPTEDADYTVKVWVTDSLNPGQWNLECETPVETVIPNQWNVVSMQNLTFIQGETQYIVGVVCENYTDTALAYDNGPAANSKADMIGEFDAWQHLSSDYGVDANWKIKLFFEFEDVIIWDNTDYSDFAVTGYNIYRDGALLAEISDVEAAYVDAALEPGVYEYQVAVAYNVMNAALLESDLTDPVSAEILEEILPPTNATVDADTGLFSWTDPTAPAGFFEGFEGTFPPAGWVKISPDGGTGWEPLEAGTTPLPGWTGGDAIACPDGGDWQAYATWATGGATSNDQWLVTPQVTVEEGFVLDFWMIYYMDNYDDHVEILLSTTEQNDVAAFDTVIDAIEFTGSSSVDWTQYTYTLTDYVAAGTPVYIAFRENVNDNLVDGSAISIDNVWIGEALDAATPVVTPNEQAFCARAEHYEHIPATHVVAQRELEGYNVYLDGSMIENTTETSYQFTGLIHGTTYTAGVEAVYTSGTSDLVEVTFEYTGTSTGIMVPAVTKLNGNYPNPFNPTTAISYSLSSDSKVRIDVFNIKGEKVRTLVNETMEAGNHTIQWNGTDENNRSVASGVYFYKMRTGNYNRTQKMLLLK
jgi:hypothetical protein